MSRAPPQAKLAARTELGWRAHYFWAGIVWLARGLSFEGALDAADPDRVGSVSHADRRVSRP